MSNSVVEEVQTDFPSSCIEESNITKQRQQQYQILLQKIQDTPKGKNMDQESSEKEMNLKQNVFSLYSYFEKDWVNFTEEGDLEIGNCYKFCINKLNIFKNILRTFFSYMKNKGDDIVIECLDSFQKPIQKVKKQFIRFSERHPANNKSMTVLFEYDRYGRQFEYFLNIYAVDWLIKSKVKDIIPHLLSIFFLIRCFKTPQLKEQLKVYKKTKKITLPRKVRKSNKNDQDDKKQIKCEDQSSMQIDSYNAFSESLNSLEENKSVNSQCNNQQYQDSFIYSNSSLSYQNIQNIQNDIPADLEGLNYNIEQNNFQYGQQLFEQTHADFNEQNHFSQDNDIFSLKYKRFSQINDQTNNIDSWLN